MNTDKGMEELAIAREYTLRLHHANCCGRAAIAKLEGWEAHRLTVDQIYDLVEEVLWAEKIARRGIKHNLLTDITNAHGVHLAADAVIRSYEIQGMSFTCSSVPGCGQARICAMNNLIDRMIDEGYEPVEGMKIHYPVLFDARADGCPKMDTQEALIERRKRLEHALAESGTWTEDTASFRRAR